MQNLPKRRSVKIELIKRIKRKEAGRDGEEEYEDLWESVGMKIDKSKGIAIRKVIKKKRMTLLKVENDWKNEWYTLFTYQY